MRKRHPAGCGRRTDCEALNYLSITDWMIGGGFSICKFSFDGLMLKLT